MTKLLAPPPPSYEPLHGLARRVCADRAHRAAPSFLPNEPFLVINPEPSSCFGRQQVPGS